MSYNNGIIHMMRGDTYKFSVPINNGTKLDPLYYNLTDKDAVYFGVMEPNKAFEEALIKKKYTNDNEVDKNGFIVITLEPEDTLNITVGKYYYMVKLVQIMDNGSKKVTTIIPPTQIFIDGNNLTSPGMEYYENGNYNVDNIVIDGGEEFVDNIIFDGGELTL